MRRWRKKNTLYIIYKYKTLFPTLQVKVWFQNRRMKWRHTRENLKSGHEKQPQPSSHIGAAGGTAKPLLLPLPTPSQDPLDYSSDSCSSVELSDKADDDDNIEIDVVE